MTKILATVNMYVQLCHQAKCTGS